MFYLGALRGLSRRGFFGLVTLSTVLFGCGGRVIVDGVGPGDSGGGAGTTVGTTTAGTGTVGTTTVTVGTTTGSGPSPGQWESFKFQTPKVNTSCSGDRFIRFLPAYQKFVGVILCSPTRYKILLAKSQDDLFYEIGDGGGSGQDHCELVNPSFSLPNEDDIKSGGCPTCDIAPGLATPVSSLGFTRSYLGEDFVFQAAWPQCCYYTPEWYQCGVSIP